MRPANLGRCSRRSPDSHPVLHLVLLTDELRGQLGHILAEPGPCVPPPPRPQPRRGRTNSDSHRPVTAAAIAASETVTPGVSLTWSLTQRTQPSSWMLPLPSGRVAPWPTVSASRTRPPSAPRSGVIPVVSRE